MDLFYCLVVSLVAFSSVTGHKLQEGDDCILTLTGEPGICVNYPNCTSAIQAAEYGIFPQLCLLRGRKAVVCCKPTTCLPLPEGKVHIPLSGYKAWDYCINLADKAYPCPSKGWRRGDICPDVPGPDQTDGLISAGELPHLALLGFGGPSNIGWYGTGTLISEDWVLTGTWILDYSGNVKMVKLGGWTASTGQDIPVKRTVKHPGYKPPLWYNDIGLIQLDRPVKFSKTIFPACLHTGSPIPDDGLFYTGWFSAQDYSKNYFTAPSKKAMEKVSHGECFEKYKNNNIPEGVKDSEHICTVSKSPAMRCPGSYGAALTRYNKERVACTHQVIGLHAFASCEVMVQTRVAPYVPWIENIVWP